MKKSLFIITALLLLAGTGCQKADTVEPADENANLETRSSGYTISGPSTIPAGTYVTYSVDCPANYICDWYSGAPNTITYPSSDTRTVRIGGFPASGGTLIGVCFFDKNGGYLGYEEIGVYVYGNSSGSGGGNSSGNNGTGTGDDQDHDPDEENIGLN